ncbi:DUF4249 domain-containing protein [Chitinophaga sp. GCM10012297]|uniref:DUF4249 domain-containing protein n=1 Tax=Chitinophaga chungangae TaxID=2821488 RepID=A0ABS3Y9T5_9BACT|nr:DUF4249 domain-containing protein [Chitinophaga chungangae]MBO9151437.1 DUF4249 domain-containing protein [Chitinophaga chungangae]
MRKAYFTFVFLTVIGTACEKEINVDLQRTEDMVVVEGIIEQGSFPMVRISKSLNYFSRITPQQLLESFVHNAAVTVSNGVQTHRLREYRTDTTGGIALYFYTVDTADMQTAFFGEPGKSYTLRIETEGQTFHSITTIPEPKFRIDTMWWKFGKEEDSNRAEILLKVTDPPERGNYFRYFTSLNRGRFLPALSSVFDDQVVNGTSFDVVVAPGVDKNRSSGISGDYGFFDKGDTVTLKFCNIDHNTYDFWRTAEFAYSSAGNPFSSPTRTMGNVKGALGYWGGYSVALKTIIIPK